jgi:hypothetical protein
MPPRRRARISCPHSDKIFQAHWFPFSLLPIVILGNFFVMNLFIGVLISKYNREKELQGKDFMLTESQKKWVKNRMNILQS